jgi:hypothetical protein
MQSEVAKKLHSALTVKGLIGELEQFRDFKEFILNVQNRFNNSDDSLFHLREEVEEGTKKWNRLTFYRA